VSPLGPWPRGAHPYGGGGVAKMYKNDLIFTHAHKLRCDDDPMPRFPMGLEDYGGHDMIDAPSTI